MTSPRLTCRPANGFTLMEVLIAMTLLSVMVLLLFSTLRTSAESWDKGENKIADVNEVAVVYNFFQQHLASAKPIWDDFTEPGKRTFGFQGRSQALQFIGEFPASAERGGLQLFTIEFKADPDAIEQTPSLIEVTVTPFFPSRDNESLSKEEVTLIKQVAHFELSYFGTDQEGDLSWQTEWLDKDTQPKLIKISLAKENGLYWPDMVVALKIAANNNDTALNEENSDENSSEDDNDAGGLEEEPSEEEQ